MEITVQFEAQLRHVAGVGLASVNLPDGSSVEDALHEVTSKFGSALGERMIAADGTTLRSILLFTLRWRNNALNPATCCCCIRRFRADEGN